MVDSFEKKFLKGQGVERDAIDLRHHENLYFGINAMGTG